MVAQSTVFVVDDDPSMCRTLANLMRSVRLPVQTYAVAADFLHAIDHDQPGCVILDVRMPMMSGLEIQQKLIERGIRLPAIMLTAFGDVPSVIRSMKAGALDFIQKPFDNQMLLDVVMSALRRDQESRQDRAEKDDIEARLESLTIPEREVVDRLMAGKGYKNIAKELRISYRTVQYRRAQIMKKMGTADVPGLALLMSKLPLPSSLNMAG